jgi:two-component system sensor histidine kinase/response regulator
MDLAALNEKRHESRPSLRTYLIALVLLVAIPAVAIVIVALMRAVQSYRDASSHQLLETSNVIAQSVQSELQARSQLIAAFAARDAFVGTANAEVSIADGNISTVRLHRTSDGWEITATPTTVIPQEHLIDTVRRGRTTVSNLLDVETEDGPTPMLALSTPRKIDESTYEVTTLIGNPMALVQSLMREGSFENNMVLAVTDGAGRILARSRDAERYIGQPAPDWEALRWSAARRARSRRVPSTVRW